MKNKERINSNYSKHLEIEKCKIQSTKFSSIFVTIKKQLRNLKKTKRLEAESFLDMLHLNSHEFSSELLENLLPIPIKQNDHFSSGNFYEFKLNGKTISFTLKKYFYKEIIYQLQINPKQFDSSKKLFEVIELIYGKNLEEMDYEISRCDIAFKVKDEFFNTSLLIKTARFPWKRTTMTFNQNNEELIASEVGYRTRSRSSNHSIYSNTFKENKFKNKQVQENFIPYSKFEYQLRRNELRRNGIIKIQNLKHLSSDDIFKKFQLYDPTIANILNKPSRKKFILFQKIVANLGWQNGIKFYRNEYNQNFKSLNKIVVPLTINYGKVKVVTCLKKRFKEWFAEWYEDYESIFNQPHSYNIKSPADEFHVEVSELGCIEFSSIQ